MTELEKKFEKLAELEREAKWNKAKKYKINYTRNGKKKTAICISATQSFYELRDGDWVHVFKVSKVEAL